MMLIKTNLKLTEDGYKGNSANLITIKVEVEGMESREFVVTYVCTTVNKIMK